ncbi:hypothetical protein PRIPAC_72509 [Pristionchus pacificus]|uniref:Uncharacterized protein n=1 Tax=Pristionchus pacificus TaxID=54126 RepID=A0A2A6C6P8_PRIPA|nr:hypothetical protein PRIPAC_72509 [Pristionchus pacificus]|eukprot:PDM73790.1 hypothetical protein PRIPAC_41146 [Pristionchus pacificus]
MTKSLMLDWFKECVAHPSSPTEQLVLVDSWSSFKDHSAIQSVVPPGKKLTIRNIPAGTTSFAQPLDIYFFHPFKAMVKRVTSFVQVNDEDIDFPVHLRDNRLQMISLIFKAPIFRPMLEYPWKKAGYIYSVIPNFKTPVQICFPPGIDSTTCHTSSCAEDSKNAAKKFGNRGNRANG